MAKVRQKRQRYALVSPKGIKVTVAHDEDLIMKYINKGYVDPAGKYRPKSTRAAKAAKVAKATAPAGSE